jgi:two-component system chemotaxis sensor kinase CheA
VSDSRDDLFREMFFEEAGELLATLEKGIAGFAGGAPDRATVEPVYRAAHSLKGAAGMVELAGIAELALAMEKVLGQLRSGAMACTPELVDALQRDRGRLAAKVAEEEQRFRGGPDA